jgi:hypothetical protein
VLDGPSPFEPTSASETDAGREAAVAGLVAKTTDTTTADTTTAAAAGKRGGPSPLGPPFARLRSEARLHGDAWLHGDSRLRGETRLHDEARLHGEACGAVAATAAATTNEAAAGGCDGPVPKQAAAAADAPLMRPRVR